MIVPSTLTLDSWCNASLGRASLLAAACDVSHEAVRKWRAGEARPTSPSVRSLIEVLTGGIVKAAGWRSRSEISADKRADARAAKARAK